MNKSNKKLGCAYLLIAFGFFLIFLYYFNPLIIKGDYLIGLTLYQDTSANSLYWFVEYHIIAIVEVGRFIVVFIKAIVLLVPYGLLVTGILYAIYSSINKFFPHVIEEKEKRDSE